MDSQHDLAIKRIFYSKYIEPILRAKPSTGLLETFLDLSFLAWRLRIDTEQLRRAVYVRAMCTFVLASDSSWFEEMTKAILAETHDSDVRISSKEAAAFAAQDSGDVSSAWSATIDLYKTLFESQLRLWGTPAYSYLCKVLGVKHDAITPEEFVAVSASVKYAAMTSEKVHCPYGDPRKLVSGFDNRLRNAGGGHDDWEITDDLNLLLKVRHPKSGRLTDSVELTRSQFSSLVSQCRCSIWSMQVGLFAFLSEHTDILSRLERKSPMKIAELRQAVIEFARGRHFSVETLEYARGDSEVILELRYSPPLVGSKGQILMGVAGSYDVILVKHAVRCDSQVMGILQFFYSNLQSDECPGLKLRILAQSGSELASVEYSGDELRAAIHNSAEYRMPMAESGGLPTTEYDMIGELTVISGRKEEAQNLLLARGVEVIDDPAEARMLDD